MDCSEKEWETFLMSASSCLGALVHSGTACTHFHGNQRSLEADDRESRIVGSVERFSRRRLCRFRRAGLSVVLLSSVSRWYVRTKRVDLEPEMRSGDRGDAIGDGGTDHLTHGEERWNVILGLAGQQNDVIAASVEPTERIPVSIQSREANNDVSSNHDVLQS